MDARFHGRTVNVSDDVERARVLPGYHLGNGLKTMLPVAWIDALGRITKGEIASADKPRRAFERRHAVFFGGAGIDRGLVDHDVAPLKGVANQFRRLQQHAQIGTKIVVDRRWDGDDKKIRRTQVCRIGSPVRARRTQVLGCDFAGAVVARRDFGDASGIDIKADDACACSRKTDRYRQADIAEADDGNLTRMRHGGFLRWLALCLSGRSRWPQ